MSPRERVLAALAGQRVRPVPVGAVTQSACTEQMEALGAPWPQAHWDPEMMARLAAGAQTLLGFDLVRVPFDQTIEAELLGVEVAYGDASANCSLRSHPFSIDQAPPGLPAFDNDRACAVVEAIGCLVPGEVAVAGGIVGPFTLACQLAGVQETLIAALRRPDAVRRWLDFTVALGAAWARRQLEAGADAICVEDMSASLDLTSPKIYRSLILPAHQRLIQAIPVPVILHICGTNTRILDALSATRAAALSLESRTDLAQAVSAGTCAIFGGVDPLGVLLRGDFDDVRRASLECLDAGVHLLAPGCGIAPATSIENLREMARAARAWQN